MNRNSAVEKKWEVTKRHLFRKPGGMYIGLEQDQGGKFSNIIWYYMIFLSVASKLFPYLLSIATWPLV